ncbi:MAG TPA: xanthine phosphoribosyltransferase [Lachnospiraceae bacterium]|nr:xanthine phosphoribosyltransferase [Lachnospiraceae bacterium]
MKLLKDKILSEGKVVNEHILKVDSFINHQVDPVLMDAVAKEFAEHFKNKGITKIATIESSGIAPALFTAKEMGLPLIIFKKQPSQILYHNLYQTMIESYTKETSYELTLSKDYICSDDHVLIIDDFLANGEAASGAIRLIRMSYATVAGLGVLIEKSFEPGHDKVAGNGIEVYSLARIKKLDHDSIEFLD